MRKQETTALKSGFSNVLFASPQKFVSSKTQGRSPGLQRPWYHGKKRRFSHFNAYLPLSFPLFSSAKRRTFLRLRGQRSNLQKHRLQFLSSLFNLFRRKDTFRSYSVWFYYTILIIKCQAKKLAKTNVKHYQNENGASRAVYDFL